MDGAAGKGTRVERQRWAENEASPSSGKKVTNGRVAMNDQSQGKGKGSGKGSTMSDFRTGDAESTASTMVTKRAAEVHEAERRPEGKF